MDLQIYLRDKRMDLVEAWSTEFADCQNVDISCGHIFDIKADAIISPANSFGFMDGGIDYVYSEHFGWDLQESLQQKIREDYYGELIVGNATIVETKNKSIKFLVSCPTMRIPENVSNTVNAYLAFRAGLLEILKFNSKNNQIIKSVLCPGLGTMVGSMPVEKCAKQMRHAYDCIFTDRYSFPEDLGTACERHENMRKTEIGGNEWI